MADNLLQMIIKVITDATGMTKGFDDAEKDVKGFSDKMTQSMQQLGAGLLEFLGAAAIANAVKETVMDADAVQTSLESMAVKINNVQPAANVTAEALYRMTNAMAQGTQFIDDEVRDALDVAVVKTRDYGAALQVTQDAMKLATLANIPLNQATKMLSLAYEGNTRGMSFMARQMGLNIKDGETYASVMDKINAQSKGLGDVMQNSVAVQLKKIGDQFKDVFVDIVRPNIPTIVAGFKMLGVVIEKFAQYLKLAGDVSTAFIVNLASDLTLIWQTIRGELPLKNLLSSILDNAKATGVQIKEDTAALLGLKKEMANVDVVPGVGHGPVGGGAGASFSDKQMKQYHDFWDKLEKERTKRYKAEGDKATAYHAKVVQNRIELDRWYNDELEKLENEALDDQKENAEEESAAYNTAIGNVLSNNLDDLFSKLMEGKLSWREWGEEAVKQIVKVIMELTILKALKSAMSATGGGGPLGFLAGLFSKASPAIGGNIQPIVVEMVTADVTSYVRFHNNAIRSANPGAKDRYMRVARTAMKK